MRPPSPAPNEALEAQRGTVTVARSRSPPWNELQSGILVSGFGASLPELELWKSECPPLTCPFAHLQDYFLPRNLLLEPAELSACPLDLRVLSCPMGMRTVLLPTEPGHTPGSGDAPRLRKAQADTEHPGRGCMHQVLGSIPILQTPGVALHTCNPRTRQED